MFNYIHDSLSVLGYESADIKAAVKEFYKHLFKNPGKKSELDQEGALAFAINWLETRS